MRQKYSIEKTKEVRNMKDMKLVNEIVENASTIPIECQEHILDVIKAMAFTRKVIEKRNVSSEEKKAV